MILSLWLMACRLYTGETGDSADSVDSGDADLPDADGDGSPSDVDCDDTDPETWPGAPSVCGDGRWDCDLGEAASVAACTDATWDASDARATFFGVTDSTWLVIDMSPAGDMDGDGAEDLWLSGEIVSTDDPDDEVGAFWLMRGPFSGEHTTADATAVLIDQDIPTYAHPVLGGMDVDGDGYPDVLAGAPRTYVDGDDVGAAYLTLGPLSGERDLADAELQVQGSYRVHSHFGATLGTLEDQDGDGARELVVADAEGAGGVVAVIPGSATGTFELPDVATAQISSASSSFNLGADLGTEDMDGDGVVDILVGDPDRRADLDDSYVYEGAIAVFHGPVEGEMSFDDAGGMLVGVHDEDRIGRSLATGDVDGDGAPDLAFAGGGSECAGGERALAYVHSGDLPSYVRLEEADLAICNDPGEAWSGAAISAPGDLDGDGGDDLVVGLNGTETLSVVLTFYGPLGAGTLEMGDAAVQVNQVEYGGFGSRIAAVGDLTGDGRQDLLIGAAPPGTASLWANEGAYLIAGGL